MAVSWGIRFSAIVLLAALSLTLAVLLPGGSSERADAAAAPKVPTQVRFLLRLTDLPPGYRHASSAEFLAAGFRCALIKPSDPRPQLERFLRRAPAGCMMFYGRTFRGPGPGPAPALVGSGVMRLKSVAAAEEGIDLAPQLISHAIGDELPVEAPSPAQVGERTRVFHWTYPAILSEDDEPATFLVWRWGSAAAAIFVTGADPAANDAAALALAQRQQRHLEEPEPFSVADFDDTEVELENPAIDVPIYWLGRDLRARPGLPAMHLLLTSSSPGAVRGPRVGLSYSDSPRSGHSEDLFVNVYSAAQWKRLARRGDPPGTLHCGVTSRPISLPRGSAVAFHGKERLFGRCHENEPDSWVLRARIGRAVVTVETSEGCATCAEPGRGPYNSYKGMRAIARGLELRQP